MSRGREKEGGRRRMGFRSYRVQIFSFDAEALLLLFPHDGTRV
jgi:hypothetical protein